MNVICHSPGTKKSLTLLLERVGGYLRQQQTPVETSMGMYPLSCLLLYNGTVCSVIVMIAGVLDTFLF